MRKAFMAILAFGLVAGGAAYMGFSDSDEGPSYRLAKVERGPIVSTVSASGTLAAVVTVQVGSQISGQIKEILVDYNSEVKAGQLIARLDPATHEAKLRQAEAELALAKAGVKTQEAAVLKARAVFTSAEKELARQHTLAKGGYAAAATLEKTQSTYDTAKADLAMTEAQVENARAQVVKQEAVVNQARIDLDRTYIRAPVDGVVISRDVDVGQTVAASMSAPLLFQIAQDLRKMQVEVRVDEADVGRIRQGQRATFTVDSFPGRNFVGRVEQIRKAAQTVQNVVTYSVLVSAANEDLRLLPGLTANVRIIIDERGPETLKVANAALRFRPMGVGPSGQPDGESDSAPPGAAIAATPNAQVRNDAETVAQLTKLLDLTADQQQQVKALVAESRERLRAQRSAAGAGDGRGDGTFRAVAQRARAQFDTAIAAILTPEQLRKLQADRVARVDGGHRRGQVWVLDDNGQPRAVDLTIGITDGGFTEVAGGDLAEGQSVIVGATTAAKSGGHNVPRIRF